MRFRHLSLQFLIPCSSNVGLGDLGAVDPDVDLGVLLLLLLLLLQRPPVADEVERQQVPRGAESQQPDVDLEEDAGISKASSLIRWRAFLPECACILTQNGSPSRGPIIARKRGCWRRANTALTSDCMPVRLPNCEEGKLDVGGDREGFGFRRSLRFSIQRAAMSADTYTAA